MRDARSVTQHVNQSVSVDAHTPRAGTRRIHVRRAHAARSTRPLSIILYVIYCPFRTYWLMISRFDMNELSLRYLFARL